MGNLMSAIIMPLVAGFLGGVFIVALVIRFLSGCRLVIASGFALILGGALIILTGLYIEVSSYGTGSFGRADAFIVVTSVCGSVVVAIGLLVLYLNKALPRQ